MRSIQVPSESYALRTCLALTGLVAVMSPAQSQERMFEYAVKFVCGRAAPTPTAAPILAQGVYFTDINVHNPNNDVARFRKKFAVALPEQKAGPVTRLFEAELKSDEAFSVDCNEITKRVNVIPGRFVTGFAVFQSPAELDVVAVYSAAASPGAFVAAMHMERVPKRP